MVLNTGPMMQSGTVYPASAVGAPHRRDRIWIIAYPSSKRCERGKGYPVTSAVLYDKEQIIVSSSISRTSWGEEPVERVVDGRLNPEFIEWMMGYPIGWTENIARTQRIKGLGNSLVPIIPEMIAEALSKNI